MRDRVTTRVMELNGVDGDPAAYRAQTAANGGCVGGTDEFVQWLGALGEVGLREVQVEHFLYDDDDIPTWLAEEVAPQVAGI